MSVTYHLLFFLCIFLPTCNARHLSTQYDKLEKKPHFHIKDDEVGFESFPKHNLGVMNEDNKRMETWLVPTKPRKGRSANYQMVVKAMRKDSGALLQTNLMLQFLGVCLTRNQERKILGLTWTIHRQRHILLLTTKQ